MNYLENVKFRVAEVYAAQRDNETAHGIEDGLHQDVLHWIASGEISGEDAVLCAKEALKTVEIHFERWFS